MKKNIVGQIKKIIYKSPSSPYIVGIFKVKETDDIVMQEYVNKVICFTGMFTDLNMDVDYILYGNLVKHNKYGYQYMTQSYEMKEPNDNDSIVLYLSSGIFRGIGVKTAKKIVDKFGIDTINIIKNEYYLLENISGMTLKKAKMLHDKIIENEYNQDLILKLTNYGFTNEETINLISIYSTSILNIINDNIYDLISYISFDKLDHIFLKENDKNDKRRICALIKHIIYISCYETGDTLISKEEIFIKLKNYFDVFNSEDFNNNLNYLLNEKQLVLVNDFISLYDFYNTEVNILENIKRINSYNDNDLKNKIDKNLIDYEKKNNIIFNDEQKEAIKQAIVKNFFIISGGPGTGKTTIINAIVQILKQLYKYRDNDFALLAPTGRAAKRITQSVGMNSYTIHKYLKWNKETGEFSLNEYNKSHEKIVIIDETSMIDIFLFSSLLKALRNDVKLLLLGDANQLPSIAPGDLLNDLLNINEINKSYLTKIYRVKDGSYISFLADDIKNQKQFDVFSREYVDFKFIESSDFEIKKYLEKIVTKVINKGISCDNFQVLVPMYKGINGIDSLNSMMSNLFNKDGEEIIIGQKKYRINDKVIQLVNDVDNNVYNGDIGYIKNYYYVDKKLIVEIDYSSNIVAYKPGDFDKFTLAYAISIHKSQGSEYDNVVIVLAHSMSRMFYNKLIYTAVTRAKNSLIILGSMDSFNLSVKTLYSTNRKTYLKSV